MAHRLTIEVPFRFHHQNLIEPIQEITQKSKLYIIEIFGWHPNLLQINQVVVFHSSNSRVQHKRPTKTHSYDGRRERVVILSITVNIHLVMLDTVRVCHQEADIGWVSIATASDFTVCTIAHIKLIHKDTVWDFDNMSFSFPVGTQMSQADLVSLHQLHVCRNNDLLITMEIPKPEKYNDKMRQARGTSRSLTVIKPLPAQPFSCDPMACCSLLVGRLQDLGCSFSLVMSGRLRHSSIYFHLGPP